MKFFVISLHRVGTQSTHRLLQQWNLRAVHNPRVHDGVDLKRLFEGRETDLNHVFSVMRPVFDAHDAVSDVPTPVLYPQLASAYPNAQFILLHRDAYEWVQSIRRLIGERDFSVYERVVYWRHFRKRPRRQSQLTDRQLMWMHWRHTRDAKRYFANEQARLGVFHLNDPLLAERLCGFMGRKVMPFPRKDFLAPSDAASDARTA